MPTCVCELSAPALVVENTAEVVFRVSEIVIRTVCGGSGKKTVFVGDGVSSSSSSSQRLVVVTVTKTVTEALLVSFGLAVVIKRVGELAGVVATVTEDLVLPKVWLAVSETICVCLLDKLSCLYKGSYAERDWSGVGLCVR